MSEKQVIDFLDELRSLSTETEWLEFKENNSDSKQIGEYLSSLSNTAALHQRDEAYLIFGVNDQTHEVVGTSFNPYKTKGQGNQDLESWLNVKLKPKTDFQIREVNHPDGRVVMFFVKATKLGPVSFDGRKKIRLGSNQANLEDYPDKEAIIWERRKAFEIVPAMENVSENQVLELLHYDAYFKMMKIAPPKDNKGIIEKFIQEKYLIRRGGELCITNLGAILFAVDLSNFEKLSGKVLRIIRYKGTNKLDAIKDMSGKKGYAFGFENFISHVNAQLPVAEIIEGGRRMTVDNYAPRAIREFIANALVHQDFALAGGPLVEIYEDRIEISNPGRPLVDPKRFVDTSPQSRNELLADSLRRLQICEKRGSGVDRALYDIELAQLPAPSLESGEADVSATIYARKDLNNLTVNEKLLACYWHSCVKYVVDKEPMTNTSLSTRLNIPEQNKAITSRIIKLAQSKRLIKPFDPESKSLKFAKYVPYWA